MRSLGDISLRPIIYISNKENNYDVSNIKSYVKSPSHNFKDN
jgi:hypothetical protein